MRKLLLALGLLALSAPAVAQPTAVGPANAIICNQAAQVAIGTSGLTRVVTGTAGKVIVICGWHITNSASAGTFQLSYGSGSNCGTSNVVITPAFTVSNTAPATDHSGFAVLGIPPAISGTPQDLCINPSVATIAAIIWFAQY